MGTVFPLFTQQMYDRLTYHWGTALFGFIAVLMIPIPFVRSLMVDSLAITVLLMPCFFRSCTGRAPQSALIASSRPKSSISNDLYLGTLYA